MPERNEISRRTALVILAVILCAGTFARFHRLGEKSLWLDEIMSARLARMASPVEIVREVASYDVHPPLFPLVHFLFMRLGDGAFVARLPSALFGVLSIFATYLFAARLFGRQGGLAAAAVLAMSAFNIYYSQEARHYSLAILLAILLSWILLIIIDSGERPPRWTWFAYAAVGAALLYTFVMGILLIAAHWLVFLMHGKKIKPVILRGLATQICIGLAFLPWLPSLIHAQKNVKLIASVMGSLPPPGPSELLDAIGQWMLGAAFLPRGNMILLSAPAPALFILLFVAYFRRRREATILACLTILPVFMFIALPMTRAHSFDPKHLIFVYPFVISTPAGLFAAWRRAQFARYLIPVCIAMMNLALLAGYYDPSFQKELWPEAAALIESTEGGDFILVNPDRGAPYALQRYFEGGLEIRGARVGLFVPPDAELAIRFDKVWLVTCWNEVIFPTRGLVEWFNSNTMLIEEKYFFNRPPEIYPAYPMRAIRVALYERIDSSQRE